IPSAKENGKRPAEIQSVHKIKVERVFMTEGEWVKQIAACIQATSWPQEEAVLLMTGLKLAYANEILSYGTAPNFKSNYFETDLAIVEPIKTGRWRPRVVVEAKLGSVTTHDAITYSQ